jgi:spore coat protein CotH
VKKKLASKGGESYKKEGMKAKKELKSQLKPKPKVQIKKPLQVKCFKCSVSFEVKWNRGQGKYVEKNNWGFWTGKEKDKQRFICDKSLVQLYMKDKWEYLENITDERKRVLLRAYMYNRTLPYKPNKA